jgi:hypothetical protein
VSKDDKMEVEEDNGSQRTFCQNIYHDSIISMMEQHLCAHPLIPGYSAPSKAGIREWAVKEMYQFCIQNGLRECWAYLWENWYHPLRWKLWACSDSDEIPRLRTTMICESQ